MEEGGGREGGREEGGGGMEEEGGGGREEGVGFFRNIIVDFDFFAERSEDWSLASFSIFCKVNSS